MKIAVVFFGLFVAMAIAGMSEESKRKINAGMQHCINSEKPAQETFEKLKAKKNLSDKKVCSFVACVLENLKVMKGRKILPEVILELLGVDEEHRGPVLAEVKKCIPEGKSKDRLSIVGFFAECIAKFIKTGP